MNNLKNKAALPQHGWRHYKVIDLQHGQRGFANLPRVSCEMCGKEWLRFVHIMQHEQHEGPIHVGRKCATKISGDNVTPKESERRLRNRATIKARWLTRKWKTSRVGNPYLKIKGKTLCVFLDRYRESKWMYSIDRKFSKNFYSSEDEAKLALYGEYHAVTDNAVPLRSVLEQDVRP